ncbi:hypothetical protein LX32DRAFT_647937 [Colletotrichum zoysiae]|uniref:Uncharacterized protein n=1 Tax=Colletotrichum zoysiae TaxID=1216348 RepID=A0AAD9MAC3_9PEZI|nr:hypothetical protein LX32DRAFT_647937 [Colletotrichum zoysiae]
MKLPTLATTGSLVLLALSQSALGCSVYRSCHCYDSDGTPNNDATETSCSHYGASDSSFIDSECKYIGPDSTGAGRSRLFPGMSNCDFRELCAQAGATGSDSSCSEKITSKGPVKVLKPNST